MLHLEPGMMIWTWVTFVVLFFVLGKVAWKPILSAVEQREKKIKDSIQKAEKAKTEAETLLEKHEKMMTEAQNQIQKMFKENKDTAEKMKNDLLESARLETEKMFQRAKQDIDHQKEAAIIELKKQVADLAIQAASKLIQENMDQKKHRDLVDRYIQGLDSLDKN
jgi:F-type H+-transporting ATPase subunit b